MGPSMLFRRTILLGSSVLAGAIAVAGPSFAQSAPQARPGQAAPAAQATDVGEIVVTGSRIRRSSEFTSAAPLTVITTEQTDLRGVPDAAAALQSSSIAAGSFQLNDQLTGYNTAGGGGTQAISLRGLGEQRTLTLINGRRAGPAGTRGQVQAFDLNVIPQSQVDRFDILKDGASSIYGSDAVAGVINIITKRDMNGGAVNFYASQPFENGGEQYRADATFGRTFDRGYFSVSGEYYRAEALRKKDRADTACAQDYVTDVAGGKRRDYINSRTGEYRCYNLTNNYISVLANAGAGVTAMNIVPTSFYGSAYNYNVAGNNSPYAGYARFARGGYPGTYAYQPSDTPLYDNSTVISPVERYTLNFVGGYKITPNVELYTELLYNHRKSSQVGAGQVFQSFAQRNTVNGAPNYLPASNPNNTLRVNAVTVAAYESSSFQEIDYYRGVIGARGDFQAAGRDFTWDIYGQYSYSDAVYNNGPRIYLDRLLALNSPNVACTNTPIGGNVSNFNCADLPNGIPWMSDRVLGGNFNQAERNFLFVTEEGSTTYKHGYIEGVLSTDRLLTLPAGDVGVAAGFQVRHEAIDDQPPAQAAIRNLALYTSAGRTTGSDDIREAFAEFEVPLLRDLPFIESLTLNASGRISDYDSYGTSDTYKASLNWQLTPEFRIRGSYGTSFRAPALYELYLGNQVGYSSQANTDPCINYGTSGVDAAIVNACSALGIAADYNGAGGSSATISTNGGAGRLEAETAKSSNIGVIWTPRFADLNISVDYFDIEIENEVRQFGAYNIIEQCLRGKTEFCGLFERATGTNYILTVNNSYVNVADQTNRGIDLNIRYSRPVGGARVTFSTQHTWKLEDHVNLLGGAEEDTLHTTFANGGPAYAGNANLTVSMGDFTWYYGVDMLGRGSDLTQPGVNPLIANAKYADLANGLDSNDCSSPRNYCVYSKRFAEFTSYHSTSLRYRVNDWTFQAGVNNLFDERPPSSSATFRIGTAALNGYDMRGRRGFVRIGRTF